MLNRKKEGRDNAVPEDPIFNLRFDGNELVLDMLVPAGNRQEVRTVFYSTKPENAETVRASLLYFLGDMMLNKRLIDQSDKLIPARPV